MKLDIGGGVKPRGEGFVNIDCLECADVKLNLGVDPLPFEDNSVDEVYSSHCLEHVVNVLELVGEILRVCKIGAKIEIRVPHWAHPFACHPGHVHVISNRELFFWCEQPPQKWTKNLIMTRPLHYQPEVEYDELRTSFPLLTDEQVLRLIPGCCWEVRAYLEVVLKA